MASAPTVVYPTSAGKPVTLAWPKGFDAQQQAQLEQLSQQGLLSGIPPQIIAYIQEAESSFGYNAGGVINTKGYGGYFGLSANSKYPAGTTTPTLLKDTSQTGYAQQAIIAASSFASDLNASNGDFIAAENTYQTGSPRGSGNGAGIFEQYGINPSDLGITAANPFPGPIGDIAGLSTGGTIAGDATTAAKGAVSAITSVDSFFTALGNGFGLGWAGIFTIILGGLMIIVGIIFIFRKQAVKIGEAAVAA